MRVTGIGELVAERGDDVGGKRRITSSTRSQDSAPDIPGGLIEQAAVTGHPRAELGKLTDRRKNAARLILGERALGQKTSRRGQLSPHEVPAGGTSDEIVGPPQLGNPVLDRAHQSVTSTPSRVQLDYLRRVADEPQMREPLDVLHSRPLKRGVKAQR